MAPFLQIKYIQCLKMTIINKIIRFLEIIIYYNHILKIEVRK